MMASRTRLLAVCFAATTLVSRTGTAQNHPIAAPIDSVRLALARRVLEVSGTTEAMLASMRANLPAQRAAMPQVPPEFWTRFEARIVQDAPQLVDSIAVLYAVTLTRPDLEALVAFYTSPVRRRLRAAQPALVTQGSAIGQRWGMRIGAEIGASLPRQE